MEDLLLTDELSRWLKETFKPIIGLGFIYQQCEEGLDHCTIINIRGQDIKEYEIGLVTNGNCHELLAKHTPMIKEWLKDEYDLERNTQSKP